MGMFQVEVPLGLLIIIMQMGNQNTKWQTCISNSAVEKWFYLYEKKNAKLNDHYSLKVVFISHEACILVFGLLLVPYIADYMPYS